MRHGRRLIASKQITEGCRLWLNPLLRRVALLASSYDPQGIIRQGPPQRQRLDSRRRHPPASDCREMTALPHDGGAPERVVVLAGAHHAFDVEAIRAHPCNVFGITWSTMRLPRSPPTRLWPSSWQRPSSNSLTVAELRSVRDNFRDGFMLLGYARVNAGRASDRTDP
jgi:hypothetical protein